MTETQPLDTTIELDTGELLLIPHQLDAAIAAGMAAAIDAGDDAQASRTAFAAAFAIALFREGLVLAPLAHAASREAVDLNTYTLVLAQKHALERTLHEIRRQIRPGRASADLFSEFLGVIDALTGHAPPAGTQRLAGVEERLRQLRRLLLGTPLDTSASEIPDPLADYPTQEAAQ